MPLPQPFQSMKIHYAGSVTGVPEADKILPEQLISYLENQGANILNGHIATPEKKEDLKRQESALMNLPLEQYESLNENQLAQKIYELYMRTVDEATHVIALVNGVSFGVGMELQRALDKPSRKLPVTPILCLVHENFSKNISPMIRGAAQNNKHCYLKTYTNLESAKLLIFNFLSNNNHF